MKACNALRLRGAALLATLAFFAPLSHAQNTLPAGSQASVRAPSAAAAAPAKDGAADEASSYSVGLVFSSQLRSAGLEQTLALDALVRGLKEGLAGRVVSVEDKERAVQLMRSGREALATRNRTAARDYLARNASAPGVTKTASGLQYQVIEPGDVQRASPAPADRVTLRYRGRLLDGTEFDNSDSHAQAATFSANSVIKGWREALLLMRPGAKWRLFVPPELGYDLNSPPNIPPGSLLIYDVELTKVEPATVLSAPAPKEQKGAKAPVAGPAASPVAAQ
jgi:FKBP-type peptidyl-prolyl cis-trans isomerase FklB